MSPSVRAAVLPLLISLVVAAGCKKKPRDDCERLRKDVASEIAKGPGACSTSADCGRYPPSGVAACGGVANKDSADKIDKLVKELDARKCEIGESACEGYWYQHAECVNGQCASVRNPSGAASH